MKAVALEGVPCPRCGRPGLVAMRGKDAAAKVRCGARWRMTKPSEGSLTVGDLPMLAEQIARKSATPTHPGQDQLDEKCGFVEPLDEFLRRYTPT